jgi:superfamily I DNA/RNA helicase
MRTPSYEDLSKEQDAICVLAPLDGATLVSGPPGTGKTVVAFYRAEVAAKKQQTPRLIMYNNVLWKYSSNASNNQKVKDGVDTYFHWFGRWWKQVFRAWVPQVASYSPDWEIIIPQALSLGSDAAARQRAFEQWGHLIIDEGQDFAKGFYQLAAVVLAHASANGAKGVAVTVLADENQRLSADKNSCLADIESSLTVLPARHYTLKKNYRNTYEIARVAAHFYCGLKSGIPALPDGRHGNIPRLLRLDDLDASVETIRRFIANQSDLEVGVFLPTQAIQTKYYNKLVYRLKDVKGVRVQRFTSGDKEHGDADALVFDRPGTVTVLCDNSCKGLEFDAVFIPELQARRWDPAAIEHMRMQFYVLSSRARQHLTYLYSARAGDQVPILDQFPGRNTGLLEWIDG